MRRRRLIGSIGSLGVGLLAGCLGAQTGAPGDDGDRPTVAGHSIVTTGATCQSDPDGDRVEVDFGADGVVIDGVAPAPNPCHEARIETASIDAGDLRVGIGFDRVKDVCIECVGAISYTATVDVEPADAIETVTVEHGESGKRHTVRRDGAD